MDLVCCYSAIHSLFIGKTHNLVYASNSWEKDQTAKEDAEVIPGIDHFNNEEIDLLKTNAMSDLKQVGIGYFVNADEKESKAGSIGFLLRFNLDFFMQTIEDVVVNHGFRVEASVPGVYAKAIIKEIEKKFIIQLSSPGIESLHKAIMFTPLDPNVGPTCGADIAFLASNSNLINLVSTGTMNVDSLGCCDTPSASIGGSDTSNGHCSLAMSTGYQNPESDGDERLSESELDCSRNVDQ
ncbi:hypothetical protein L1987_61285 [Smallanthus sonchifolius]|uniref:Uncharacterized protein n=1 Tax=Smallanthus sonchifolius TaxID=185202 RepID=A0ACB9DAS7_9ASTR|nr:hypothetical protein L1987_61285 [Smallanthus sonchifolius]